MRKHLLWVMVTILAAMLETTWLQHISLLRVVPDLTLLVVLYFAMNYGEERAMLTGAIGGIINDIASNETLGFYVLCHVVIGYAAARVSARLITEHPAAKATLVFCASIMFGLLDIAVRYVLDPSIPALNTIIAKVVPGSFYTALFTPVVFFLLDRMFRKPREWKLSKGAA